MFYLYISLAIAILTPLGGLISRKLRILSDLPFFIIYAQSLIYLQIAPAFWLFLGNREFEEWYVYVMLICSLFFSLPFFLIYLVARSAFRARAHDRGIPLSPRKANQQLLVLASICFTALFLYVSITSGLVFRRIGIELTQVLLGLSFPRLIIYRLFVESAPFLLGMLVLLVLLPQKRRWRTVILAAIAVVGFGYFADSIVNSRLHTVIALGLVGAIMAARGFLSSTKPRRLVTLLVISGILFMYGFRVTGNFRTQFYPGFELTWSLLNPIGVQVETESWAFRLNGVDLMARLTPVALDEGFALGDAWRVPALVAIGQFVGLEGVSEYKATYLTTAKRHLMLRYTDLQFTDYPSSIMTDAYGNFWIAGVFLVALTLALLVAYATAALEKPASGMSLIVAVFILGHILTFEKEFIDVLLGWIKAAPVLAFALLLNPFRRSSVPSGEAPPLARLIGK